MLCGCRDGHRQSHCAKNLSGLPGLEEDAVTSIKLRGKIEHSVRNKTKTNCILHLNTDSSHPSNLGSVSTVWIHWCCGPNVVQFCAKPTIAPASRSP